MVQILTLVFATLIFKRTTTVFENHHNKVLFWKVVGSNPYISKILGSEPSTFKWLDLNPQLKYLSNFSNKSCGFKSWHRQFCIKSLWKWQDLNPQLFKKELFVLFFKMFFKKVAGSNPPKTKILTLKMHNFPLQILFKMTPLNHFQLKITSDKAECVKCHHYWRE